MTSNNRFEVCANLVKLGISYVHACELRRISMTLHRWHELECGDGNDYASWTIARGQKSKDGFIHDESGRPYLERHLHSENKARYESIPDRERGAQKRLNAIMAQYPELISYIQGDPRGASLYILRRNDVPRSIYQNIDSCYSRGAAVYK